MFGEPIRNAAGNTVCYEGNRPKSFEDALSYAEVRRSNFPEKASHFRSEEAGQKALERFRDTMQVLGFPVWGQFVVEADYNANLPFTPNGTGYRIRWQKREVNDRVWLYFGAESPCMDRPNA